MTPPKTFLLLHGAWHGGWCWAGTQRHLQEAGAGAYAPSLDGLSERSRPGAQHIGMQEHAQEVLHWLAENDGRQVILVGHSYAGNIISLVADALKQAAMRGDPLAGERVSHYVFLDAIVPPPEVKIWRWSDSHSEEVRGARLKSIQEHDGWLPAPPPEAFGVARAEDLSMIGPLLSPMPGACYTEPVEFRWRGTTGLKRSYLAASRPAYATLAPVRARVEADIQRQAGSWQRYDNIACGHDIMIDEPAALAQWLLSL
jgi:pimeloyl-ACP methyl ester carboxylesterase